MPFDQESFVPSTESIEYLLSLPPASVRSARDLLNRGKNYFVASDPPGSRLGSGGGTAHLLHAAWMVSGIKSFPEWLGSSRKLLIHGSGQSRRLPGYAAEGKPLLPLPHMKTCFGQQPDQRLLDIQIREYGKIFRHAPDEYRIMVACGDVLLLNEQWPPLFPQADVLIAGLHSSPEEAQRHGVLFCRDVESKLISFFLQKPSPETIQELAVNSSFLLDTGIWLLSARAISALMERCGWVAEPQTFRADTVRSYEMYDTFALALGEDPRSVDPEINSLQAAALPIQNGRFLHFGTNRSVMASTAQLASPAERQRAFGHGSDQSNGAPVILSSRVEAPLDKSNRFIWIDVSNISRHWRLSRYHVLTGIPPNEWHITLPEGICLDFLPLPNEDRGCLRVYGFDDVFRGALDDGDTLWMNGSIREWAQRRGISWADTAMNPRADIQDAALFPVLSVGEVESMLQWMIASQPSSDDPMKAKWINGRRLSASDLVGQADIAARNAMRRKGIGEHFGRMSADEWRRLCPHFDLEACARILTQAEIPFTASFEASRSGEPSLFGVHNTMFNARLAPARADEADAFKSLRDLLTGQVALDPVRPAADILEDQIVWARSPVRLDFAGGWTDTPPYCIEHGGSVVNVAVDMNGQPPIQVFARICDTPHIVLRSIDLGIDEVIADDKEFDRPAGLGGGFSIARAALRLAGFDQRFHVDGNYAGLKKLLKENFGGGLELSMLAAVPKGSGLGTSSILAATLLGALGEICGLHWGSSDLFTRTLVLEQMLTSGGGWQDQVGGIIGGLKLIDTAPGLIQNPVIRWLPSQMIREAENDGRILLLYTGLTRVARNILGEIVRRFFLNEQDQLSVMQSIGQNAGLAADAAQKQDWEGLCETIRRSWRLNQALDSGTNPPEIQAIVEQLAPWSAALKLLGAGGGGYMLIFARDAECGRRIRKSIAENPPNPRARFVTPSISESGLQITRS